MVTVFADGSIRGHVEKEKIECWAGWYALGTQNQLIHHDSLYMGENPNFSSSSAEYEAIRLAMEWLASNWEIDFIRIMNDNKNVIEQLMGKNRCHSADLQPRLEACRRLEAYFVGVEYVWIRREFNTVADAISRCEQTKYGGRKLRSDEVLAIMALEGQKDD